MEVGREYFKNNNVQDLDLDVMPDWQIAVGRKKFEAVEQPSAAEEVAEVPDAADTETPEVPDAADIENDQGKEVENDCPQEVD